MSFGQALQQFPYHTHARSLRLQWRFLRPDQSTILCPAGDPSVRSAAYAALKRWDEAASDALRTTQIDPKWPKGWARLGAAYMGMENFTGADS